MYFGQWQLEGKGLMQQVQIGGPLRLTRLANQRFPFLLLQGRSQGGLVAVHSGGLPLGTSPTPSPPAVTFRY